MSAKKSNEANQVSTQEEVLREEQVANDDKDENKKKNSLTLSLQKTNTKIVKVRFTLDLEKSLDTRLTEAATKLNRSKADLTRIALEMLLKQLEDEWNK